MTHILCNLLFYCQIYVMFLTIPFSSHVLKRGDQIWAQSGSDYPKWDKSWNFFKPKYTESDLKKFPGFVPFRVNLTHFGPKSSHPTYTGLILESGIPQTAVTLHLQLVTSVCTELRDGLMTVSVQSAPLTTLPPAPAHSSTKVAPPLDSPPPSSWRTRTQTSNAEPQVDCSSATVNS